MRQVTVKDKRNDFDLTTRPRRYIREDRPLISDLFVVLFDPERRDLNNSVLTNRKSHYRSWSVHHNAGMQTYLEPPDNTTIHPAVSSVGEKSVL
jgi:hypothetical protein